MRVACAAAGLVALALSMAPGQSAHRRARLASDEVVIVAAPYRPEASFSADSNAVQVEARVLDSHGKPAAGLQAGDFRIADNGQAQTIASFTRVVREETAARAGTGPASAGASAPGCAPLRQARSILLYFDDFSGTANDIAYSRSKLLDYLAKAACNQRLPEGETIGLVTGSGQGDLAPTADASAIRQKLAAITLHPRDSVGGFCPLVTPYQAWEILNAGPGGDAMKLAMAQGLRCGACGTRDCETVVHTRAEQIWGQAESQARATLALLQNAVAALARQPGRRTLILTSSGFLTQELPLQQQQQRVIDLALKSNVVINALDAKGLTAPTAPNASWDDPWLGDPELDFWRSSNEAGGFSPVDSGMWEIAESTGGDFLHDNNDLRAAYQQDIEGPEYSYSMTFTRPGLKFDGSFHRLKVTVTAPGDYRVAARYGYFAPSADQAPLTEDQQQELIREVLAGDRQNRLEVALAAKPASGGVHLDLRLNPKTLALKHTAGRHDGRVVLIFALLTPQGKFVTGERADVSLHLTDAALNEISRPGTGLPVGATLAAPPGAYRVRIVAVEPGTGALATLTGQLAIAPQ
ncbi:MAG: VWA domain-containing protein [Terriglobales bacterium]